jgi:hypothetical protein
LTLFTYTAEPGSPSEDALKLLGSWQPPSTALSRRGQPTKAKGGRDTQLA